MSLEDLYKGKTMKFNITHTVLKPEKFGSIKDCNNCGGSGVEVKVQRLGPIIQQFQVPVILVMEREKYLIKMY